MKITITIFLIFAFLHFYGQTVHKQEDSRFGPCEQGTAELEVKRENTSSTFKLGPKFVTNYQSPIHASKKLNLLNDMAIWIGGKDAAGNLHVSASNKSNSDFVPGALNSEGQINENACEAWDLIFTVTKEEIEKHLSLYKKYGQNYDCDSVPYGVKYWPADKNPFIKELIGGDNFKEFNGITDYWDDDTDNYYDPCSGDFPTKPLEFKCAFNGLEGKIPSRLSVFRMNDAAGLQQLTGGNPSNVGIDVYQWSYDDEAIGQNVTFYSLKIINYADVDLIDTYITLNIDPQMGCGLDDKAGIYPSENLIFLYNKNLNDGENTCADGQSLNYYPYVNGIKFLKNPRTPKVFERDVNGNVILDSNGEKILKDPKIGTGDIDTLINLNITKFWVSESCDQIANLDCNALPNNDFAYYNTIQGKYKNGSPRLKDGQPIDYMYDGLPNDASSWNMLTDNYFEGKDINCGLSFGPLHMQPGAINRLAFAVFQSYRDSSIPSLGPLLNDCQALANIDGCMFDLWTKPQPPKVSFEDINEAFNIIIDRDNDIESKVEIVKKASDLPEEQGFDLTANFEGYILYQLKDENVTDEELANLDSNKVKRIYVTDLSNDVEKVFDYLPLLSPVNYNLGSYIWKPILRVLGPNTGIDPIYKFSKDLFKPNGFLMPNKQYYFASQTYMYNNWKDVDENSGYGQRNQFIASDLLRHSHTYKATTSSKDVKIEPLKIDCTNGSMTIRNAVEANYSVYTVEGKELLTLKGQGNDVFSFNLQTINNSFLIVKEWGESPQRVVKLVCK